MVVPGSRGLDPLDELGRDAGGAGVGVPQAAQVGAPVLAVQQPLPDGRDAVERRRPPPLHHVDRSPRRRRGGPGARRCGAARPPSRSASLRSGTAGSCTPPRRGRAGPGERAAARRRPQPARPVADQRALRRCRCCRWSGRRCAAIGVVHRPSLEHGRTRASSGRGGARPPPRRTATSDSTRSRVARYRPVRPVALLAPAGRGSAGRTRRRAGRRRRTRPGRAVSARRTTAPCRRRRPRARPGRSRSGSPRRPAPRR